MAFGQQRIGLVNAPEHYIICTRATAHYMYASHREAGWRAALAQAQLAEGALAAAEATEENGFRLARGMLELPAPPTAILCATDRLAAGALHALSFAGLRAGRDVSLIGYDDLPASAGTDPPLTPMDQMVDSAAAQLVKMLVAVIGGADQGSMTEIWQARLMARGSDGPCRAMGTEERIQPVPTQIRTGAINIKNTREKRDAQDFSPD
jgi:LacI family transcriptional regulator